MLFDLQAPDLATIAFLIFLEGVLSMDNALAIALIAGKLPKNEQKKALSYGLLGAILFRISAILLAAYLLEWHFIQYVGAAYLIFLGGNYWRKKLFPNPQKKLEKKVLSFWGTVVVLEFTDIIFAIDSILTAVALTKKVLVVIIGGILGLLVMRFAASFFLKILEKFPRFEAVAYILVLFIGLKLFLEALALPGLNFHSASNPAFLVFWCSMAISVFFGFTGKKP